MPHGSLPAWFAAAPFATLLCAIAVLPLAAPAFWEHNRNKAIVSGILATPIFIWLGLQKPTALLHSLHEYVAFLLLVGSLFVITGGIFIEGDLEGKPETNVAIMALGATLANIIGTTGASLLLIRLLLRTNGQRQHTVHLPVFFILLVSNCGGLLTPLGDPPLFLGYLRGIPFTWTLRLYPIWALTIAYLLAVLWVVDRRAYAKEPITSLELDRAERLPIKIHGWRQLAFLGLVIGSVFLSSPWRELVMLSAGLGGFFLTKPNLHSKNAFSFGPVIEVGILFLALFITMVPALELLKVEGPRLGLASPVEFFLATGALSSVLDNAPTYLALLSAAEGLGLKGEWAGGVTTLHLTAISLGAVFMGANTYIGNGPNFMVKAVADQAGWKTPSFFRYSGMALLTLGPVYLALVAYFTWAV
ncbi:MAG: sodium:proton antiporter [Polyangiaceae bacterium]|nr:sodium:proton antiporter [Polyangiaceae bacterium]